jgi:hypothetical protein
MSTIPPSRGYQIDTTSFLYLKACGDGSIDVKGSKVERPEKA